MASAGKAIAITIFLVAVAWFYRTKRPMEEFEVLCTETSLLLAFSAATAVLTYLVTSINFPLIDERLIEIDTFLGFDRLAYVGFVSERPLLGTLSTAVCDNLGAGGAGRGAARHDRQARKSQAFRFRGNEWASVA